MVNVSLFTAFLAVGSAVAQFVKAPSDLKTAKGHAGISVRYKEVPAGICELDPRVKSFSGYADVAENEHIFWWFFEARNADPRKAPLVIFLNGGPGSSSMIGLMQSHGPCRVEEDGSVVNNPYAWSNFANLIFIDQPTQTGFSYSIPVPGYIDPDSGLIVTLPDENCPDYAQEFGTCGTYSYPNISLTADSTPHAAPNFWKTLQGFTGAFPQYSQNGIHFGGESYVGHYGPIFSDYILNKNENLPRGAKKIDLQSVFIGNGWFDPLIQYPAYYNFSVWPGNTYDVNPFNKSMASRIFAGTYGPGNCVDKLKDCNSKGNNGLCTEADSFCYNQVQSFFTSIAHRSQNDIRELNPDPFPNDYGNAYLNSPKVLEAIGAFQNYSQSSGTVSKAFDTTGDDAREVGTVAALRSILRHNVRLLLYFGDADFNCNWLGGEVVADNVKAPGWSTAGYANATFSDGVFHAQVKESGLFSFMRIFESGHIVPFYQPLVAMEMVERFIKGFDMATGKEKVHLGYKTKGPMRSTYREGNGTVQWKVLPSNSTYNTTTNRPNLPKIMQRSVPLEKKKTVKPRLFTPPRR